MTSGSDNNPYAGSLIMDMEWVPTDINDLTELLHSTTPTTPSPQRRNDIKGAAEEFIKSANENTVKVFEGMGEKLAGISGKVCKDTPQKVTQLFETISQCNDKEIKNSNTQKFVKIVNNFINRFSEKAHSVETAVKKPLGKFTSKILHEVKNKVLGKGNSTKER